MTISSALFSVFISIALVVTIVTPVLLIYLWIKDWKDKKLW